MVVQLYAGQPADQPVEHAAGQDLVPGIVAHALPAADHVESFFHFGQKARDFGGVVLQVGVEGQHQVAVAL